MSVWGGKDDSHCVEASARKDAYCLKIISQSISFQHLFIDQ